MNKNSIIIGLGFGDECKGMTVNSICKDSDNEMVIRFNSGHQCGHTVVYKGINHVFASFGSGTLKGVPTYITEYCTVYPIAIIREAKALLENGITPKIYFNVNAMVTTPFDIVQNHNVEAKNNHGTVGVGFGTTIQRNDDHYHLYVRDLFFPKILEAKLKNILNYYHYVTPLNSKSQQRYDEFINACKEFVATYNVINGFKQIPKVRNKDLIFEGGQGIMLDQEYGFFPNVTRSYTTSRNAMEFIQKNNLNTRKTQTYYITRAYQTRHGNGYMSNESMDISYIKPNPDETNGDSGYQGIFRKTVLDLNLLLYALSCDSYYNPYSDKILVITCLDQINDQTQIPITANNELLKLTPDEIGNFLNISNVISCNSEEGF